MKEETILLPFDLEPAPGIVLNSGELTCLYETGRIRYLRYQGIQVIRLIYTAVRDKDWNTADIDISNESVVQSDKGFTITYDAAYFYGDTIFKASINIMAEKNTLSFSFKGKATKDFERNRIGICVLLPVFRSTVKELNIFQPDGIKYKVRFPELVSPHQPAKNIRGMSWQINDNGIAVLELEGDIFEMEDQRNWSDDSYKVYSTPVDLPLPVNVFFSDTVEQAARFSIEAAIESLQEASGKPKLYDKEFPMPEIGYCRVPGRELTRTEIDLLKQLPFHHYRVELLLNSPSWTNELKIATLETRELGTLMELIVFADSGHIELNELKKALEPFVDFIDSILVVDAHNGKPSMDLLNDCMREFALFRPPISIGYGTNNHFADLNRNPPEGDNFDFLSFGITPQAHADDLRTIIENLDGQSESLEKINTAIAPGKKVHVSPVTFKARIRQGENSARMAASEDGRLHTNAGAFWTLSTLANVRGSQVTLFDTVGETGIIRDSESELPPLFKCLSKLKAFSPLTIEKSTPVEIICRNGKDERLTFIIETQFAEAVKPVDLNENH